MANYELDKMVGYQVIHSERIINKQREEIEHLSGDMLRYLVIIEQLKEENKWLKIKLEGLKK